MPELVLLDSNVILDVIQELDNVYIPLRRLIERAKNGESMIVISSVSRAEVKYLKQFAAKGMSQDEQNSLISGWFNSDYIYERVADRGVCDYAADLRRIVSKNYPDKALTPVDSIILATAGLMKVSQLITLDNGESGGRDIGGRKPIGLLELSGKLGNDFPEIDRPENYKGQTELDLVEQ